MKLLLASGAILGFVSVAFGAYSEHGLKPNVTAEDFRFLMTAVRYNQINSAVICSIGLFVLIDNKTSNKLFKISGLTFVAGTVLFSFSIYLSILLNISSPVSSKFFSPSIIEPALICLLYTSPSPRDRTRSRMPSSA